MDVQEFSSFPQGTARLGNDVWSELPGVRDDWPDFDVDRDASSEGTLGEARGVVAEHFVATNVDQERGQTLEVRVEGRCQWVARVRLAEIVASGGANVRAVGHSAAARIRADGLASCRQIRPRREER